MKFYSILALVLGLATFASSAFAGIDGSISGTVTDDQGVPIPNVQVQVLKSDGTLLKEVLSSPLGEYQVFPITLGDYTVSVKSPGVGEFKATVHVASGSNSQIDVLLAPPVKGKEMVLNVEAKRRVVQTSTATSSKEVSAKQIEQLPQGDNISLPHLLATTNPGVIQGPFGQTFIRGNHANIQYQIDGVQLPDSQTNTFGDVFTPRNIDHMEVITGGVPAEYGNRLAAVINIVTKSGPEIPNGAAEVNYGSYNTFSPWAVYGGSNEKGDLHYFMSAQYTSTNRGLDTPQPQNDGGTCGFACGNQSAGGTDAIHDSSNGNNEFFKIDWLPDNDDKISVVGFNNYTFFNLPNYPSNFLPTDALYQSNFTDTSGNSNSAGNSAYFWTPYYTNDNQSEDDAYAELVWKHSYTDHSFLQTAAYYKYSNVRINNDPTNDLLSATFVGGASPASLFESRHVNNVGLKGDFTDRINSRNLFKAGYQLQDSMAAGALNTTAATNNGTPTGSSSTITGYNGPFQTFTPTQTFSVDNSTATGLTESVYAQNDFTIAKNLIFNVGLRFDAIQYYFRHTATGDVNSTDNQIEPRIGLNYFLGENTKLHAFYGRLFQPAPLEDLRDTFVNLQVGNGLAFYDIKAEKDNYYEVGIAQQVGTHVLSLNSYYKSATDMLDDTGLLNTSIAAAYNYSSGYAYGVELSEQGQLNSNWSDYLNYSYEIAKGQGASGGLFAIPAGGAISPGQYVYLDHVQVHTVNSGLTYSQDRIRWTTQGLFGSGLRTGPGNSISMPSHFTVDTTVGYDFHGDSWISKTKVSVDMLNIFNNGYPITYANGYNGAHYAPGREYFLHLTKEL